MKNLNVSTKAKVIATALPVTMTMLAVLWDTTIFGSWGALSQFKDTIVTEWQNSLTWVISIVIWLIWLYLLPVILRYLGVIVGSLKGAMSNFFGGRKK